MKIVAVIDECGWLNEGTEKKDDCRSLFQMIKKETESDTLILVTSGNFTQQGEVAFCDKYTKAEKAQEQGADLILELPVYCTLTTEDTVSFAAVSMLEKLNCVDELVILCEDVEEGLLKEIVQFLFIESKEYQELIQKFRAEGMTFFQAQASATEQYIPGAKKVLSSERNCRAVEYAKAMKRMYSTMKLRVLNLEKLDRKRALSDGTMCTEKGCPAKLSELVKEHLDRLSEQQKRKCLNETAGGYAPVTEQILNICAETEHSGKSGLYEKLSEVLVNQNYSEADLKRYLLRVLIGVRHMEISICGLYSYALYVRVLAGNNMIYNQISQSSWIPVFKEEKREDAEKVIRSEKMDDSRRMLLELDRKAQELYDRMSQ